MKLECINCGHTHVWHDARGTCTFTGVATRLGEAVSFDAQQLIVCECKKFIGFEVTKEK